jgi:hypothetical protein
MRLLGLLRCLLLLLALPLLRGLLVRPMPRLRLVLLLMRWLLMLGREWAPRPLLLGRIWATRTLLLLLLRALRGSTLVLWTLGASGLTVGSLPFEHGLEVFEPLLHFLIGFLHLFLALKESG